MTSYRFAIKAGMIEKKKASAQGILTGCEAWFTWRDTSRTRYSTRLWLINNQHGITVAEKTILLVNGVLVGIENIFAASQGGDQH